MERANERANERAYDCAVNHIRNQMATNSGESDFVMVNEISRIIANRESCSEAWVDRDHRNGQGDAHLNVKRDHWMFDC
jgi:hypothetical protein